MKLVCHKDVYAAVRSDISEQVEVFIDASFNVQAKILHSSDVSIGVGWSMLDQNGSFVGYGVTGLKVPNPKNPEIAELRGILKFFNVLKNNFQYSYHRDTKFIVRNDNKNLMLFLNDFSRYGETHSSNSWSTEAYQNVIDQIPKITKMFEDFNVEFRWVKGHTDNHFNNLADELAHTCFVSERKGQRFVGDFRVEAIKGILKNLHHATGGRFNHVDQPRRTLGNTIGSALKDQEDKLKALMEDLSGKRRKKEVTYPQILNDDMVYSAVRYPLKKTAEVFIKSSYDLEEGEYGHSENIWIKDTAENFVAAPVSWAFLNDSKEFAGYGVFELKAAPTQSAIIAELRGILAVFDILEKAFYDVYDEGIKFIVHIDNKELVAKLSRLMDKNLGPGDLENKDFRDYLRTLVSPLKTFSRTFDAEFRWTGETETSPYWNFSQSLASTCHQASKEDSVFHGDVRMDCIKENLKVLKDATGG